jgi:hypothetical protein
VLEEGLRRLIEASPTRPTALSHATA